MKVSVITVCFNAETTIAQTLTSVAQQSYKDIEHIIVDGASTDETMEIVQANSQRLANVISEPDQGLYDAMNKGLAIASGDIVGILNADDVYQDDNVVARVVESFTGSDVEAVYADLVYVEQNNLSQVRRTYISGEYRTGRCFEGWMPAHPTLYLRREVHEKIGHYNLAVGAQADLEYCARAFEIHKVQSRYVAQTWVRMRIGGVSNRRALSRVKANWRSYLALRDLGLRSNPIKFFFKKFATKLPGFISK